MCKYINFNNLRKKKWFTGGVWWLGGAHLYGNKKKTAKKTQKERKYKKNERKHEKQFIF